MFEGILGLGKKT